jgi:hypothetical protein
MSPRPGNLNDGEYNASFGAQTASCRGMALANVARVEHARFRLRADESKDETDD